MMLDDSSDDLAQPGQKPVPGSETKADKDTTKKADKSGEPKSEGPLYC